LTMIQILEIEDRLIKFLSSMELGLVTPYGKPRCTVTS
jgi:hypothetical protein